jgi:[acyl-carrier-protein] S-malonyltransferase
MAAAGITDMYEIGSGKVLGGLAKRIVPALNAVSIGTPQDIDGATALLAA